MILRNAGRSYASLLLVVGTVGCASIGATQAINYRMVPPADLAARAAVLQPVGGLAAPVSGQTVSDWTAGWIEGPVSSIATEEEFSRYGKLDNDVERAEFIRLFWHRRNPEPDASYNESLLEFDRRLAVANDLFSTAATPGWRTPFGRTLLTLGFPTVVRIGDRDGPRAATTEAVEAERGDRVFWQYGLLPEDLAGTSVDMARAMSTDAVPLPEPQPAAHMLTFTFWRGGWRLNCDRGWLVGTLGDSWGRGGRLPVGTSGTGYLQQGRSTDAGVGESFSPDVVGSGGVYMDSGTGGGGPFLPRGPARFGPSCRDVFGDARSAWLFNTVYYP